MATSIVTFISVQDIKQSSYVDENVDEKTILNSIREAQDLYILPLIGTGIYNQLVTQITNNTVTTLNNTLLRTYIFPALKNYTLATALPMLNWKITNKAVMKKDGENSQSSDFETINKLIDIFFDKAESYTERAIKYLEANNTDYPLYYNPGNGIDIVRPKRTSFQVDWTLGDSSDDCDSGIGEGRGIDIL